MKQLALDPRNVTIVYDNEKRSHETVKKMRNALLHDFPLFIWPTSIEDKDVNAYVLSSGWTQRRLMEMIDNHTYSGEAGLLILNDWKRTE